MWCKLVRHTFPDRPDWIVINESVPLGTRYKILFPMTRSGMLENLQTGEKRLVECYLVQGNQSVGMMVSDVVEIEDINDDSESIDPK